MLTRRRLLTRCSLTALLPSALSQGAPRIFARAARAPKRSDNGCVLVVLELNGGNDGLNTVVPFRDELYRRARPTLALDPAKVLGITDAIGLHPNLRGFAELLERDQLAIVQGVGYPQPSRSHDVSRLVWHTARTSREEHKQHGWLGRALDTAPRTDGVPAGISSGSEPRPHALFARRSACVTMRTLDEYDGTGFDGLDEAPAADPTEEFVRRTALEARGMAERLRSLKRSGSRATYPETELARRLELVSKLVQSGLETRVYYVQQPGYDTHAVQRDAHAALLRALGDALRAFIADLEAGGLADRVLVLVTSEFGRRVQENASFGTDHGSGAPLFLAGPAVSPGLHGPAPRLDALVDGDIAAQTDFRSVYAAVLEHWLGLDSEAALGAVFPPAKVLRT